MSESHACQKPVWQDGFLQYWDLNRTNISDDRDREKRLPKEIQKTYRRIQTKGPDVESRIKRL